MDTQATENNAGPRELAAVAAGIPASDGDGVRLTRIVGTPTLNTLDPFLLLDVFESDRPDDYIGGFPDHPHRGFETVTYLLAGRMRHRDNAGHEGVIGPGGVQWMTAGRGIVHSEMPEQEDGLLKGFQLWVNLSAKDKMTKPAYQEFPAEQIAVETNGEGDTIRVIAGRTDAGLTGPVRQRVTDPLFLDVSLAAERSFSQRIPESHNAFVYAIDGGLSIGNRDLSTRSVGVLSDGDSVKIRSGADGARFLLVAGKRLDEPVARGGPFVMNTKEEVQQAFRDYQTGRF